MKQTEIKELLKFIEHAENMVDAFRCNRDEYYIFVCLNCRKIYDCSDEEFEDESLMPDECYEPHFSAEISKIKVLNSEQYIETNELNGVFLVLYYLESIVEVIK